MKVYLDTSVFSALFDARNPERKELTKEFFSNIRDYEVYSSNLTRIEIDKIPDNELREKMQKEISLLLRTGGR